MSLAVLSVREEGFLELRFKYDDYIVDAPFLKETWEANRKLDASGKALLVISGRFGSMTKEAREMDMFGGEFAIELKALAIVVPSIHKRLLGNLFFALRRKTPSYPYKMFANEAEAITWLMQYV